MKKNYIFLMAVMLLVASSISAQHVNTLNQPTVLAGKVFEQPLPLRANFHTPSQIKSINANTERWYNFGDAMDRFHNVYLGDTSGFYRNYLFPDSTILVDYGSSGYGRPWIHMLGDILDVESDYFNDPILFTDPNELFLTANDPYYLDSLDFYFIYDRHINTVVDSLIFEVAVNNTPAQLTTPWFCCSPPGLAVATNLGTDTVFYKNVPYLYTTNELNLSGKHRYAFPLDSAFYAYTISSVCGTHHIAFPLEGLPQIQPGNFVVVGIQFKPGYSWIPNVDTLTNMNSVRFTSYKELPGLTPPASFGFPEYTKYDFNLSYIVPKDVRYNMAGSWNGLFVPSYSYMNSAPTYLYEHHTIYYKVRAIPQGQQELDGSVMTRMSPNPVSGISVFSYKLEATENVDVIITDINGRVVRTMNEGMQSAGIHTMKVDGSTLAAGLYSYTLQTKTISATVIMSVAR